MSDRSHRSELDPDAELRFRSAGLLLQLARIADDRSAEDLARKLKRSADRVRALEKGEGFKQNKRARCLDAVKAYLLGPVLADRFLGLMGEVPMSAEERKQFVARRTDASNPLDLLFAPWHGGLEDTELQELAFVLGVFGELAGAQGVLKGPVKTLTQSVGTMVSQALTDRGLAFPAAKAPVAAIVEPIEGLLAEIADRRVAELDRRVRTYISSGAHTPEGGELAAELGDLIRIAPRRWRAHLRYLRGSLHNYSQSYVESVEDFDLALREFIVSDDISSLRTQADATYAAGLAYLDLGDRPAFQRAHTYLKRAEDLYSDLQHMLPEYSKRIEYNRIAGKFQRARILSLGWRRDMGPHFEEAEEMYRQLLEDDDSRNVIQADPFFLASVLKERGDNLRLSTETGPEPHVPAQARQYFLEAIAEYSRAEAESKFTDIVRNVECLINRGYIHRLLGDQVSSRRDTGRAHRLALRAGLTRQIGHTLLHMADAEWRGPRSRVFAAYVGAEIAARMGAKRNEEVCREVLRRLGPELGGELNRLPDTARASPYRDLIMSAAQEDR